MRDPHVVSLKYRLETHETSSFENPPPVTRETDEFNIQLCDGVLTLEMKDHYSSIEAAKKAVGAFLRAWEIDAALRLGRGEINFVYENAEIIDRDPPKPGEPQVVQLKTLIGAVSLTGNVKAHVIRHKYPDPPEHFTATRDVEELWERYQLYLDKHESSQSISNYLVTRLQDMAGGKPNARRKAAQKYGIQVRVLDKLAYLAAITGDHLTTRKVDTYSTHRPLTHSEIVWIDATIKAIIRRVGEYDKNRSLTEITMSDLPPI